MSPQAEAAKRTYTPRAIDYDASWHPDYSRRFMDLVPVQPGDRVLDLACGTGLAAILAADRVGDQGIVVGVDITEAMLAEAKKKFDADPILARRATLVQHDVTDLATCVGVEEGSFEVVICSNTFILFEQPDEVISHWKKFLKPGGIIAIDVPHENSLRASSLMEKVFGAMGIPFPANQPWIKSQNSLRHVLETHGFAVEVSEILEKRVGTTVSHLGINRAGDQFDYIVKSQFANTLLSDELKDKARPYFRDLWEKAAVGGKVEASEVNYAYVARKR